MQYSHWILSLCSHSQHWQSREVHNSYHPKVKWRSTLNVQVTQVNAVVSGVE